jgi:hypothetical protein
MFYFYSRTEKSGHAADGLTQERFIADGFEVVRREHEKPV